MRNLLAILLTAMVAFSGCLDGDEPAATDDEPVMDEPMMDEPTEEDFGEYVLELATGHCHAKDYTDLEGGAYYSELGGGNWVIQESNGVPGLQLEDNHPGSGNGAGFEMPVDPRCTDGDQAAV